MCVIKAKLLAARKEYGDYTIYVFENLDSKRWEDQYVMTVRFPNWNSPLFEIGDEGFLEFKEVFAGDSTWYDNDSGQKIAYKYDNIIFQKFVIEPKEKANSIVLL